MENNINNVIKNKIDYRNKLILAPMVRVGTLPMRLLALEYGADLVYTEELIDWKILKSKRRINDVLGTVDFVDQSDGTIIFRTCKKEKEKVILQIGTSDPERALKVGKMVEEDVAGIDINMGCPKEFSIKGGMGVALLRQPEKAKKILTTLIDNLKIPITCKIRILSNVDDTIALVKDFQTTGISAIAIHGRTKEERPQHPVHKDIIKKIAENVTLPVIANGGSKDIQKYSDIIKFRNSCGTTSVMVARAAQGNASIFRKHGLIEMDEVIKAYLKLSIDYDNSPSNTKYCIQNILKELQETPRGKKFLESQTMEQICDIWDMGKYCRQKQLEYQESGILGRREMNPTSIITFDTPRIKKRKIDHDITEHNVAFIRANYPNSVDLPKTILHAHASKHYNRLPNYETQQEDKLFRTIITYDRKRYASSFWEKNKKFAEQGAALVCLLCLGIMTEQELIDNGSILR